MKNSDFYQ